MRYVVGLALSGFFVAAALLADARVAKDPQQISGSSAAAVPATTLALHDAR